MEYRIIASSIYEPAHIARVIMDWYHRPSKPAMTPSGFPGSRLQELSTASQQSSIHKATRTSPITAPATRHPILGKGGISQRPAATTTIQSRISASTKSATPISSQPAISQTSGEFEIAAGIRLGKVSSLGDNHHDYFFWQEKSVLILERFSGHTRWITLKEGWDNPQIAGSPPANQTLYAPEQLLSMNVSAMTKEQKLVAAVYLSADMVGPELKQAVLDLVNPVTVGILIGMATAYIASWATGIGEIATLAGGAFFVVSIVFTGASVYQAYESAKSFYNTAVSAQDWSDLKKAARFFADFIIQGGFTILSGISTLRSAGAFTQSVNIIRTRTIIKVKPSTAGELVETKPRVEPTGSQSGDKKIKNKTNAKKSVEEGSAQSMPQDLKTNPKTRRVSKPAGQGAKHESYSTDPDVPARYREDPRFGELSKDPAHQGGPDEISPKTRQEAMAGLEAEKQGLIKGPIEREPSGNMEFFDGNGSPIDVKTPPGGKHFNVNQVGNSVKKELTKKGAPPGTALNKSGVAEPRQVLLDCTYMTEQELSVLRNWLQDNLSPADLNRITEVNTNLN